MPRELSDGLRDKEYLKTKNREIVEAEGLSKKKPKKEKKKREPKSESDLSATIERTKELIEEGLSIDAVAEKRSMTRGTIEHHVAELVLKGYADAKDFMSEEHYENIVEYFTETQDSSLGAAKDVLGEEYSWGELRIVLNEIKRDISR